MYYTLAMSRERGDFIALAAVVFAPLIK